MSLLLVAMGWLTLQAHEPPFEKLSSQYLANAIRVHPQVISGGLPADQRAFEELRSWGVKTVISVDAAAPNAQLARQYGMRYIHLPHGYDGIPDTRVKELAKALRELSGPIYVHCHHGQHRSPAATAAGCVTAGLIAPNQAVALLALAGTSSKYRGLYRSVQQARPLPPAELAQLQINFRERAEVPPLAHAMVSLEHTWDQLTAFAAAGWQPPPDHPDITAEHESLLLREHYLELLRTADTARRPAAYRQLLQEAQQIAQELQALLSSGDEQSSPQINQRSTVLKRIEDNCRTCHAQFRDNPAPN